MSMAVIGAAETQRGRSLDDAARDLRHYLQGEYLDGHPFQVVVRRTTKSGGAYYELSDKLVSRLEIDTFLPTLPYRHRRIVQLLYQEGMSHEAACLRLHIGPATLRRDLAEAMRMLAHRIYDWAATERNAA